MGNEVKIPIGSNVSVVDKATVNNDDEFSERLKGFIGWFSLCVFHKSLFSWLMFLERGNPPRQKQCVGFAGQFHNYILWTGFPRQGGMIYQAHSVYLYRLYSRREIVST